jgi:nicotinamide riboside transporter PnuC
MKKAGIGLVVVSYMLLLYTSLAAPAYAGAHQYLGPAMLGEYTAPWPVALACTVAVAGIMLALVPLRRDERWALWTLLAMFIILFVTRITTDPRCLVVLDPHQHGCHTFMIAVLPGIVGLALNLMR